MVDVFEERRAHGQDSDSIELSVVVPTYNEATNIEELLRRLHIALNGRMYELIVVDDDSPDETWKVASDLAEVDPRIRVIRRVDERGLSSAIVRGMRESRGKVIAAIDADLQHDESILGEMTDRVIGGVEVVVGSRTVEGGGFGEWSFVRRFASWGATLIARTVTGSMVSDPMSGFFAVDRDFFERVEPDVNPRGFKVLLELLARGKPDQVAEVGYVFRDRMSGETKVNSAVMYEYMLGIIDLRLGRVVSSQTVSYALVTVFGMIVNLVGYLGCRLFDHPRSVCAIVGFEIALIVNFFGNNHFTFRSESYRGLATLRGLAVFQFFSLYGMVIQFSIFRTLKVLPPFITVPYGGAVMANIISIWCASLATYFVHRRFTWNLLRRRSPEVSSVSVS